MYLGYLATDTALFLTHEDDRILLRKQRQHFQPVSRYVYTIVLGFDKLATIY
jgi:hypothetical protein